MLFSTRFSEPFRCEACRCLTHENEFGGSCHAGNCWRTDLCDDCAFTCQYCTESFCEEHSVVISEGSEPRPRYACRACQRAHADSELLLHLQNIAVHAIRSGWEIVAWRGQPGILNLIAATKNDVLLGAHKAA
jgi:hypothetical protein